MNRFLRLLFVLFACGSCDIYDNYGIEVTETYIRCNEWGNPRELKHKPALTIMRLEPTEITNESDSVVSQILKERIDSSFCFTSFTSQNAGFPNVLFFDRKNESYIWLKGCNSSYNSDKERHESIGVLIRDRWYVLENVIQDVRFMLYLDINGESHIYRYETNTGPW